MKKFSLLTNPSHRGATLTLALGASVAAAKKNESYSVYHDIEPRIFKNGASAKSTRSTYVLTPDHRFVYIRQSIAEPLGWDGHAGRWAPLPEYAKVCH